MYTPVSQVTWSYMATCNNCFAMMLTHTFTYTHTHTSWHALINSVSVSLALHPQRLCSTVWTGSATTTHPLRSLTAQQRDSLLHMRRTSDLCLKVRVQGSIHGWIWVVMQGLTSWVSPCTGTELRACWRSLGHRLWGLEDNPMFFLFA